MLQRLPMALAQVKAGNNSDNLLKEIKRIVYSLYQSNEITKNVCNNIIKSIQWNCIQWSCPDKIASKLKMDTIFMNSEKSKTSESQILIFKPIDKLDLRRGEKIIASSNLSIYYTWKNIKVHTITINLKYQL